MLPCKTEKVLIAVLNDQAIFKTLMTKHLFI